jgi:glycosyltransferase involved in cell wall biosynthesis
MRLLFVIDQFGAGGAQRQMVNLALELQPRHEVEFFVYYPEYEHFAPLVRARGIPVHSIDKRVHGNRGVLRGLRTLLQRERYDGVLAFLRTPSVYAELACASARVGPLVVSERSSWSGPPPLRTRIQQRLHRLADHVVVNSYHQRETMIARYPWLAARSSTILNGVDLDRFQAGPPPGHESIRLLAVGRLAMPKNPALLLEALEIYARRFGTPPIISWAGRLDSPGAGRIAVESFLESVSRSQVASSFRWLGERTDVPELLREHDALIHPSLREGMPNAVCEALAAGRPVLAGDVGDHARLVREGVTGYLFSPTDAEGAARAIRRFVSLTAAERAEMGNAARAKAEADLSIGRAADQYEALFEKLASRGRGAIARRPIVRAGTTPAGGS